ATNATNDRTTHFVYDVLGQQRFVIRADGSFTESVYDALGRVSEQRAFGSTALTESALSTLRANHGVGDGVTRGQIFNYDSLGRVTSTTDAMGFTQSQTYNALGQRTTMTDALGAQWSFSYDRAGRLHTQTAPAVLVRLSTDSAPVSRALSITYAYDALGNLTSR